MTTQAEDLLGARVTGTDGKVVGTVEQVFRDDVDGTPAWARVRSGKTGRFVPLGSCQVTAEGLIVPFDTQKIMGGPNIDAGQHMSAAQAEELSRYYGLTVPAQQPRGRMAEDKMAEDKMAQGTGQDTMGQDTMGQDTMAQDTMAQDTMAQGQPTQGQMTQEEWLVRQEERIQVGKQMLETGRIKLHKYVDVEPIDQAIHVFHEEYDVERIPITADERITGNIQEGEQEIILHEERAVLRKEVVPVERVRLRARRVEEDTTVHDELRRERIEIEPDQAFASSQGSNRGKGQS
jgi:pentapeptide MXKDX repeat protein